MTEDLPSWRITVFQSASVLLLVEVNLGTKKRPQYRPSSLVDHKKFKGNLPNVVEARSEKERYIPEINVYNCS